MTLMKQRGCEPSAPKLPRKKKKSKKQQQKTHLIPTGNQQ